MCAWGIGVLWTELADIGQYFSFTGTMTLYAIGGNWINSIYFPEGMEDISKPQGNYCQFAH